MTRVYETLIEVKAKNELDADKKLSELDIYQIELEQCCIVSEDIDLDFVSKDTELENDFSLDDKASSMFINQINR
jgi:hypothetical protein